MHRFPSRLASLAALCAFAATTACEDGTSPVVVVPVTRTITLDASTDFAYLRLDSVAEQVSVSDPSASTDWDMGFFSTTVTLNGGAAGPSDAVAFCLCQNGTSAAELQAMTPANQLAAFEAVTAADIPADDQFAADQLDPVISGWFTASGSTVAPVPSRSWIVREGTAMIVLAKVRIATFSGVTPAGPTSLTLEFAVQPTAGAAFGATQTATFDPTAAPVYVDLTTGQITDASNWDLRFSGWDITVNGGVSGSGDIRAVADESTAFANIDAGYAGTVPSQAYRSDRFSGVITSQPWYRYNITGTDNQIWPTFQVYLVKRGTEVYKVQMTGYYSATGAPRNITVRYAQLAR